MRTKVHGARLRVSLVVALGAVAAAFAQQRSSHGPPYSPEEALATFRLAEGFRIELFAAEPLISDPVAMEVDENGRMYVVEMHGYPLDVSGTGRVILLTDTNGDGTPDRSTIFADGLRLPAGIMRWKNGVLVTDSPDVLYLEDTNGDGRADIKRVVLTGFALSNPQHTTNTPLFGLDNWLYVANEGPVRTIRYQDVFGDQGTEIRFPDRAGGPHLPPDGGGRNVRFKPDTFELEALSARSQFGQTFDAWGHHFLNTNNRHIYQEVVAARYASRNPALTVTNVVEQLPDYRQPAELFPVTESPEYQLLTDVGVMTAASGVTLYLADLFPQAYQNAAFVAESAHNLVHVDTVRDHGVTFRASRMFDGREFLASTDAWFRPVNFYIGPDGALYLIDYYRKIIEHPEWLDDATAQSKDLYAGRDKGRIYRIVPAGAAAPSWLNTVGLGTASVGELVNALARPNIWWRRNAQRLLVDRKPRSAIAPLVRLAMTGDSPAARVHALWTLQGMRAILPETIAAALADANPGVRENAIRIAELDLRTARVQDKLVGMAADPDPRVRFQLLLTLGSIDTPAAATVRTRLLFEAVEDEWMQIAALSAPSADPAALFEMAASRLADRDTPGRRALFARVAAMAARTRDLAPARHIVRRAATSAASGDDWWRAATLQGLAAGIRARNERNVGFEVERQSLMTAIVGGESTPVRRAALQLLEAVGVGGGIDRRLVTQAERLAADANASVDARTDAVHFLGLADAAGHERLFRDLLGGTAPGPVQAAAVRAISQLQDPRIPADMVAWWDRWTPVVRDEAVRALVRDSPRVRLLLDAVAAGKIRANEIDRPLRIRLMMLDDDELRNRARGLFGGSAAPKEAVGRYQPALGMRGDPDRGRETFTRVCAACHQYRGSGGSRFGPDLSEVRGHLPATLLLDVLDPNHAIAQGYDLWIATLTDGSSLGGVIAQETPASVTFRQPGGVETVVARAQIQSLRVSDTSGMPEGLESQIDLQQMADLLAFLKNAK